jgi:acyl-CoA hydrolase
MEKKIVNPFWTDTVRLVKGEDLNHHGTLFAGRTAEWFVESGFVSAASLINPKNVVCLKIHGMYFTKPVRPGQILKFSSKIVFAGKSSLVAYIHVTTGIDNESFVSGFITFIHVDETTNATPHNIEIQPQTEEEQALYDQARMLRKS